MTGLIIGSLTPDFEYFLRMRLKSDFSHTWGGLFWFDLPLGLLLAFVFHNLVRDSLVDNLPAFLKSRFTIYKSFDWNGYCKGEMPVIILSLLIGSASHILWDGLTHKYGYFVQIIPELRQVLLLQGMKIPVYKLLQHTSTLVGGLFIFGAVFTLPASKVANENRQYSYWFTAAGLTLFIIILRLFTGLNVNPFGHVIVTAISAGCISLIITPWITKRG